MRPFSNDKKDIFTLLDSFCLHSRGKLCSKFFFDRDSIHLTTPNRSNILPQKVLGIRHLVRVPPMTRTLWKTYPWEILLTPNQPVLYILESFPLLYVLKRLPSLPIVSGRKILALYSWIKFQVLENPDGQSLQTQFLSIWRPFWGVNT